MSKNNLKHFSKSVAETLTEKQKRVIEQYATVTKLKAVMRWKQRMQKHGMTAHDIGGDVGMSHTRLSEYMNYQRQPQEDRFLDIENAIYKRESK